MNKRVALLLTVFLLMIVLAGCANKTPTPSPQTTNPQSSDFEKGLGSADPKIDNSASEIPRNKISSRDLERSSDEGQVSLSITFANPLNQEKEGYLTFITVLNTHTVDLSASPLNRYAKLYDTKGNLVSDQPEWEPEGEGHHLTGKLSFKTKDDLKKIDGLKLVIENYGGAAKREFIWDKQYIAY